MRQLYCLAQLIIAPNYPFGGVDPSSGAVYVERRARELAQWAVNVVDFRDTDSAMTRFEYDATPFAVDGGDGTYPGSHPCAGQPIVWVPEAGHVVWGMEFPDLLLTESMAFHDKRVRDTDKDDLSDPGTTPATGPGTTTDPDPTKKDDDFDQYRLPQGSLFLELFCPRSVENVTTATNPHQSLGLVQGSLYTGNVPALQLGAMTPADGGYVTGDYGQQPVFRIGISHPIQTTGPNYPQINPALSLATHAFPTIYGFHHQTSDFGIVTHPSLGTPDGYNTTGLVNDSQNPNQAIKFDRMVWFANRDGNHASILQIPDIQNPGNTNERAARVFYNKAGANVNLEGGSYLVVGPRGRTHLGSNVQTDPLNPVNSPSRQAIVLNGTNVNLTDFDTGNLKPFPPNTKTPLSMIAVCEPPSPSWIAAGTGPFSVDQGVGLNISEPLATATQYYTPMPTKLLNGSDNMGNGDPGVQGFQNLPPDAYVDFNSVSNTFPDTPFDYNPAVNPVLATPGNLRNISGTYANERVAYLQRVADPELPYHPIYNPYITIDWISLDLTVFNGEDNATNDPNDSGAYNNLAFQSRYKDGSRASEAPNNPGIVNAPMRNAGTRSMQNGASNQTGGCLYSTSTAELFKTTPAVSSPTSPGDKYFNYEMGIEDPSIKATYPDSPVSLGYLNTGRQVGLGVNDWDGFGPPQLNANTLYAGGPLNVLAGLFWFNRDFINQNELMLVPRTAPGQFGDSMTVPKSGVPSDAITSQLR